MVTVMMMMMMMMMAVMMMMIKPCLSLLNLVFDDYDHNMTITTIMTVVYSITPALSLAVIFRNGIVSSCVHGKGCPVAILKFSNHKPVQKL